MVYTNFLHATVLSQLTVKGFLPGTWGLGSSTIAFRELEKGDREDTADAAVRKVRRSAGTCILTLGEFKGEGTEERVGFYLARISYAAGGAEMVNRLD